VVVVLSGTDATVCGGAAGGRDANPSGASVDVGAHPHLGSGGDHDFGNVVIERDETNNVSTLQVTVKNKKVSNGIVT